MTKKRLDLLGIDFQADELGTEAAAIAEAVAAYERKEPFLLYLWEPHWFFGAYDNSPIRWDLERCKKSLATRRKGITKYADFQFAKKIIKEQQKK